MAEKIIKTENEWQQDLTREQYRVCRTKGTEAPFKGQYTNVFDPGQYECVCCGSPLFTSDSKFNTSCGWPSFYEPIDNKSIIYEDDLELGMKRTEVMCANCDSHLGHVFDDGPEPTGQRFCINSVALVLNED